jgi:hypothetical protein
MAKTRGLIKENIDITKNLYEKLENGEYQNITLKKKPFVVKLFGGYNNKPNLDINNVDELYDFESDEEKKSKMSECSNSIDYEIQCEQPSVKM